MSQFYHDVIKELLDTNVISRQSSVLVVAGGQRDKIALQRCGLEHVTISNLDERVDREALLPYDWSYQDAERLTFDDESFDYVVVHWGLHHCSSPHRALLELYRVSRRGVIVFEPYDNALTRLGVRLGFGQDYETAAVFHKDFTHGGMNNSEIPNYVYRWTEREFEKTIKSADPFVDHQFRYFHRFHLPERQLRGRSNRLYWLAAKAVSPVLSALTPVLRHQTNAFAAVVLKQPKPQGLKPWLRWDGERATLNKDWFTRRYTRRRKPPAE